ncbi:MAG: hypothetical protein ACRERR_13580 [Moraxellaceae bacterium]
MKSQDILLLLKLVSLEHKAKALAGKPPKALFSLPSDWQSWQLAPESEPAAATAAPDFFSMRALEESVGISKSEVSSALQRCYQTGLAKPERESGSPRTNTRALFEFIASGLKYVFPAQPGALVRGIATGHAAPVLAGRLMSGGESIFVWEDAHGSARGQSVQPLFKSVPKAVRQDAELYAMLALVDAIRLGNEREAALAKKMLQQMLRGDAL